MSHKIIECDKGSLRVSGSYYREKRDEVPL